MRVYMPHSWRLSASVCVLRGVARRAPWLKAPPLARSSLMGQPNPVAVAPRTACSMQGSFLWHHVFWMDDLAQRARRRPGQGQSLRRFQHKNEYGVQPNLGWRKLDARLVLLWLLVALDPLVWGQEGEEVDIPDAQLRGLIEDALGKPRGEAITSAEMATLTELSGGNSHIVSLSGLEFATSLTNLSLRFNQIVDISPLAGLTGLEELDLRSNKVADVKSLADLTGLIRLFVQDNLVSDISAMDGLANLATLDVGGNEIADISSLVNLANLEWLNLRSNPLNSESVSIHIPDLEGKGGEVLFHDDHGNQLSTATSVALGTTLAGKIDPQYDVDRRRFASFGPRLADAPAASRQSDHGHFGSCAPDQPGGAEPCRQSDRGHFSVGRPDQSEVLERREQPLE